MNIHRQPRNGVPVRPSGGVQPWDQSIFDGISSLPFNRLICIARQSGIADPLNCAVTIQLLAASRSVRHCMQRVIGPLGLSEARFLTLVSLYVLDPLPSTPADLAYHAEITRSAMTDTLDQMEKQGWVRRERSAANRKSINIFIEEPGRKIAATAIQRTLTAASKFPGKLKAGQREIFDLVCRNLRHRAGEFMKKNRVPRPAAN